MTILIYIDPNSGSMLFQALIASLLGATMFFKQLKFKFISIFSSRKVIQDKESSDKIEN